MKNVNNMRRNIFASVAVSGLLLAASSSFADQHQASDKPITVTPATPDSVLLEGKNTEKMFKVKTPSQDLMLTIEGVDHDIKITRHNGEVVLHVTNATYQEIELIRQTYAIIANDDNFTIDSTFTDDFENGEQMQTSGTLDAMSAPARQSEI